MKTHQLHEAASRLSRSRNLSIREARSILSKRGAAERKRKLDRTREPAPLVGAWWNRDLREE